MMAGRVKNGAQLSRQSWNALMQNKQLLIFPLISGSVLLVLTIVFTVSALGLGIVNTFNRSEGDASSGSTIVWILVTFVYYLISYTVIIFSNTALVGATMKLMRGEKAGVSDGISIAMSRMGKILVYALISATVGMLARSITESGRKSNNAVVAIVAVIVGSIVQGAWNLVVFFAIPVLVAEDVGVVDSLKRSYALFKQTWGEGFVGSAFISGVSCLVYVAIFVVGGLLIAGGIALQSIAIVIVAVVLLIAAIAALSLVSGAVNGIFQASLYKYATTGDAGPFISTEYAAGAFE
ncbi:MAG: DUF6159 family protein [Anaerolineae bacterium]